MKYFLKKLLVFSSILILSSTITPIILHYNVSAGPTTQTYMTDSGGGGSGNNNSQSTTTTGSGSSSQPTGLNCRYFLGLTSWDCGVNNSITSQDQLSSNIWIIAANILTDIGVVASYLVIGYVIYGGYLYMFSSGDPNKVSAGKKTLTHAFTGLAIVILASVVIGTVRIALLGSSGNFSGCLEAGNCANSDPAKLITDLINWVIGIAGLVSVIFVFIGGISYMTSSGDSAKLQKAKNTITYALIGLAIVALAEIIVSFVSGIIYDNKVSTTQTNQTIIAKEYHEN